MSASLQAYAERVEPGPVVSTRTEEARAPRYITAIGYLRAWITVLVLGHHSVLAYHPYAPPVGKSLASQPHWWAVFPVVDTARWTGFSLFVSSNEMFFMALMFLLSGLFAWNGLTRKGAAGYVRDRALRLGLPFVIAAGVIAPLAYFPSYLQMGGHGGWSGFWREWTAPGVWSSGPAWFLWVLLAFDLVIAALYRVVPAWGTALGSQLARIGRPIVAFAALFAASTVGYLAIEPFAGGMSWWAWGPFAVQTARILYYFSYFVLGVGIGACGLDRTVFAPGGPVARQWKRWLSIASAAFVAAIVAIIYALSLRKLPLGVHVGAAMAFTLSSAASSFAALALFLRFAQTRSAVFALLAPCAYGMYLIHYPVASWLQFELLPLSLPGFVKGVIVFASTVAISWGFVATLRRIPGVARVI